MTDQFYNNKMLVLTGKTQAYQEVLILAIMTNSQILTEWANEMIGINLEQKELLQSEYLERH